MGWRGFLKQITAAATRPEGLTANQTYCRAHLQRRHAARLARSRSFSTSFIFVFAKAAPFTVDVSRVGVHRHSPEQKLVPEFPRGLRRKPDRRRSSKCAALDPRLVFSPEATNVVFGCACDDDPREL
jgi:hypothetical protein